MSADNEQMFKMIEKLENQQAVANSKFDHLTDKISELVTIIARKEVEDHHMARRLDDCENRITNHGDRLSTVERVQAGQEAERKLVDYVLKPAIGAIVLALIGGALYAYVLKGG
tara:strand:+ start:705 stop:1046 length:342 start_codon:yes stop_codon:yes gene_type:complete